MIFKIGLGGGRYAATIRVFLKFVEVESVNLRFAAIIGVSSMFVEVGPCGRRFAAAIGVSLIIPEGSGCTPPLRGGYWSIFDHS